MSYYGGDDEGCKRLAKFREQIGAWTGTAVMLMGFSGVLILAAMLISFAVGMMHYELNEAAKQILAGR